MKILDMSKNVKHIVIGLVILKMTIVRRLKWLLFYQLETCQSLYHIWSCGLSQSLSAGMLNLRKRDSQPESHEGLFPYLSSDY